MDLNGCIFGFVFDHLFVPIPSQSLFCVGVEFDSDLRVPHFNFKRLPNVLLVQSDLKVIQAVHQISKRLCVCFDFRGLQHLALGSALASLLQALINSSCCQLFHHEVSSLTLFWGLKQGPAKVLKYDIPPKNMIT